MRRHGRTYRGVCLRCTCIPGLRLQILISRRHYANRALATQLQTLSGEFRKTQKEYLGRVKKQKTEPVEFDFINNPKPERRSLDMVSVCGCQLDARRNFPRSLLAFSLHFFRVQGFNKAQITEVEIAEDLINERDQEIQHIAESITELATIFKELAVLVIDQGTILDRIDYNMEQVVEQTEKGIVELEQAEKIQKSNRPAKCIGLLLVLIFIMTLLLILKHS